LDRRAVHRAVPRIAEHKRVTVGALAGSAGFWLFECSRIQNWIFGAARVFRGIRTRGCFRKTTCSARSFVGGIGD
jgi:hypothetical protein